jgi:hypothetical protein
LFLFLWLIFLVSFLSVFNFCFVPAMFIFFILNCTQLFLQYQKGEFIIKFSQGGFEVLAQFFENIKVCKLNQNNTFNK